jgi:hypothetical protein
MFDDQPSLLLTPPTGLVGMPWRMNSSAVRLASPVGFSTGRSNTTSEPSGRAVNPGIADSGTGLPKSSMCSPAGSRLTSSPLVAHRCSPHCA